MIKQIQYHNRIEILNVYRDIKLKVGKFILDKTFKLSQYFKTPFFYIS